MVVLPCGSALQQTQKRCLHIRSPPRFRTQHDLSPLSSHAEHVTSLFLWYAQNRLVCLFHPEGLRGKSLLGMHYAFLIAGYVIHIPGTRGIKFPEPDLL